MPIRLVVGLVACLAFGAELSARDDSSLPKGWTAGPFSATLAGRAAIDVPVGYYFLDAGATAKLLQTSHHIFRGDALGAVHRSGASGSWFAVFTYTDTGHVDGPQPDDLDPDTLLVGLRDHVQRTNVERAHEGRAALALDGWHRRPAYGALTQRLTWSTRLSAGGEPVIGSAVCLLGRAGVMRVELVTDADSALVASAQFAELLVSYSFTERSRYADFQVGERTAVDGLATLFAGSAAPRTTASLFPGGLWSGIVLACLATLGGGVAWLRRRSASVPPLPPADVESTADEADGIVSC
jgi:uncharacterized membrane-anchored protein